MRIDDIELLRLIDEVEQQGRSHSGFSGQHLLEEMLRRAGAITQQQQQRSPLANELLAARKAGFLEFDDRVWGQQPADPSAAPHTWLNQVRDFHLTLSGRDRARGRVIQHALPDREEDDGRLIAGTTLEAIARSIGSVYSEHQLPRFLRDAGVPEEFTPQVGQGGEWEYVFGVLEQLERGGSAARRALRTFIGGWLDRRLPSDPTADERRQITTQLARQGWHNKDRCLVIGEADIMEAEAVPPVGRDAQVAALHRRACDAAGRFLATDHLDAAIFEAFKAVNNRVKAMAGLDADGFDLVSKAFRAEAPQIVLADLSTRTGHDIQEGFRFIFMGPMMGIRNPDAHDPLERLDDDEAFERLAFASMLMRRLDQAKSSA